MAATPPSRVWAILTCVILFTKPTIYLLVERYASQLYTPYYSYLENFTSDLGIPYAYTSPKTGRLIQSWRANAMNANFVVNGFLYLAGYSCLLKATEYQTGGKLYRPRRIIAMLYCVGIILVAAVPGGPKEKESGIAAVHGLGALFAIAGGDLNCLLTGLATPQQAQPIYRASSMALGILGLVNFPLILILGNGSTPGFWQRISIYPVQTWEYTTVVSLASQLMTSRYAKKIA